MTKKFPITGADLRPRATARGLEMLPHVAKALLSHACQDETRLVMCGLGIDGEGESAWLCATDGCRLVRMPIAGSVPADIGNVLATDEIERAINRAEAGDVVGRGTDGAILIVIPWLKREEHTPRYLPTNQVVPRDNSRGEGEAPHFDPGYLVDAAKVGETFRKAARLAHASMGMTVGHMGGALDPLRFDLNYVGEIIAQIVIMPMRVNAGKLPATHDTARSVVAETNDLATTDTDEGEEAPVAKPARARKARAAKGESETAHVRAEAA